MGKHSNQYSPSRFAYHHAMRVEITLQVNYFLSSHLIPVIVTLTQIVVSETECETHQELQQWRKDSDAISFRAEEIFPPLGKVFVVVFFFFYMLLLICLFSCSYTAEAQQIT